MSSKGSKFKSKAKEESADSAGLKNTAKAIMEQAEQIWLAGLGAFAKAQEQSGRLYESLVKEGAALEKATRKLTGVKVDEVRGMVESTVTQVKERASDTWDRLEGVFENRVSRALGQLGIPGREELEQLAKRVDDLAKAVRALDNSERVARKPAAKSAAKAAAAPAKPAASKPAPSKAASSKPAAVKAKPVAAKSAAAKVAADAKPAAKATPAKPRARKPAAKPVADAATPTSSSES